ncbi:MAG TPA: SgcJ/EcaC family oxidoreductase [Thermoanaerobaculia bacterium]|nr:SgcJ/EcaC family oxidoreductase [Thermoanaerobaculia bacterium]
MKRALVLAVAFLVVTVSGVVRADKASDEKALRTLADQFVKDWDSDNWKGLAGVFAADGDLINPFGRVAKGRAEIEKVFMDEHTSFLKGTKFGLNAYAARLVAPDAAIEDWDVSVTGGKNADGTDAPPLNHHVTVVLTKQGGKWWAAAARPMVYVPAPGAPK